MRLEIGQQRIEQIIGIAVLVEPHRKLVAALHQLGWRIMLLEIDNHETPFDWNSDTGITPFARVPTRARDKGKPPAAPARRRSPRGFRRRFAETASPPRP